MAEISDIRQLFYDKLKIFADAESPVLRIVTDGVEFIEADNETYIEWFFRSAEPSKPFGGFRGSDQQKGFTQINVIGPESKKQKAFEMIAWRIGITFWPTASASQRPTLGTSPLVSLGPTAPHVKDHPAPGVGHLGSICTIYWHSDFPKT